ncbi:MAG: hypothetical protein ACKO3F_17045 [Cyanobium sp.]
MSGAFHDHSDGAAHQPQPSGSGLEQTEQQRPAPAAWWARLTEEEAASAPRPDASHAGTAAAPPPRRLTPWGQGLLAAALLTVGLTVFFGAWEISRRMTSRGEICLKLPFAPLSHAPQSESRENQLLRQYKTGKTLIQELPAASRAQRLRLNEQLESLVRDLDSLCHLKIYYYSEAAALLSVATGSATVVLISVALLAPRGLQTINRGLGTVLVTAGAILGVSVNFLQLGQQQQNGARAQQIYRGQYALLQRFSSSLANQRIEQGISSANDSPLLTSSLAVAELITSMETQRLAMPDPRMDLNSSLAEQTWSHLLKGKGDTPAGNGKASTEAPPPRAP